MKFLKNWTKLKLAKLQSNSLTLLTMKFHVKSSTVDSLQLLAKDPIPDSFEDTLQQSIVVTSGGTFLKNIKLQDEQTSRHGEGNLTYCRQNLCDSLIKLLDARMGIDDTTIELLEPFIALNMSADLKKIHQVVTRDLDLSSYHLQFTDLTSVEHLKTMTLADK